MTKLTVVGVCHSDRDKNYPKVIDYVKKIPLESKVSLETRFSIEGLLTIPPDILDFEQSHCLRFFWSIAKHLDKKGIEMAPIENNEIYELQNLASNRLNMGDLNPESVHYKQIKDYFCALSFLRSLSMYNAARNNESTHAIVGALHAYQIQQIGFDVETIYFSKVPHEDIEISLKQIDEYKNKGYIQLPNFSIETVRILNGERPKSLLTRVLEHFM
ncbi:MAG: hypothetical protein Q8Q01_05205 [archaeon]|nr:hypothetical protein [archaeon]